METTEDKPVRPCGYCAEQGHICFHKPRSCHIVREVAGNYARKVVEGNHGEGRKSVRELIGLVERAAERYENSHKVTKPGKARYYG